MQCEAMVLRGHGAVDVLNRETLDVPDPGPREVRIRVRAVAMNHMDLWVRRGLPHLKLEYPHRLGCDIVGEVESVGPGARSPAVGARVVVSPGLSCGVCARCLGGVDNLCSQYRIFGEHVSGGYAELMNVPDTNLVPYPDGLAWHEAAATPLVFLTAWQMLVDRAKVMPGETVLIHAAGSGVSSAAIQIAKMFGARVIATVGHDDKIEPARRLGADEVINYATEDFVHATRGFTQKRGAEVVLDHVGGEVLSKSILAAAWGGRIVTCGATAGHTPAIDLKHVFFRQIQILGSTMGSKGSLFAVMKHIEAGKLRPVVDRVMPLWEARAAHTLLEERKAFGKIVLLSP